VSITYDDGVESSNVDGLKLNYSGLKPESGTVMISKTGQVAIALFDGKYCVEKGYEDEKVTIVSNKTKEECKLISNPEELIEYTDSSGASKPELSEGMIPIKWDGTKWVKADITEEWYNYDNKEWANVVLVNESTRETYKNALVGTEIINNDVMAYLVWIPRYRYKLFDVHAYGSNPQTIEVVFEEKNISKSNGSSNGTWLTHPAFTFWDEELNGLWVGKFETTGTSEIPTIKPGETSLRNQNVSAQ